MSATSFPTLSVRESFRPTADMLSTVHERGEMVNVRGRLYPLLRLYEAFNIEPQTKNPEESIVIVIEAGQDVRCLLVDQLLGKQEVVIKSLGETFKANPAIAGAAIMGDGRVGLILGREHPGPSASNASPAQGRLAHRGGRQAIAAGRTSSPTRGNSSRSGWDGHADRCRASRTGEDPASSPSNSAPPKGSLAFTAWRQTVLAITSSPKRSRCIS
jgi:hypothetical protein